MCGGVSYPSTEIKLAYFTALANWADNNIEERRKRKERERGKKRERSERKKKMCRKRKVFKP